MEHLPSELLPAHQPLLLVIESLTTQILVCERSIASPCQTTYPETAAFTQVYGVAEITALSYLLTLEDPARDGVAEDDGVVALACGDDGDRPPEPRESPPGGHA